MSVNIYDKETGELIQVAGNANAEAIDDINKSCLSYSTDEQLTGGTWINGKPIYRKVLILDVSSDEGSRIEINSLNIEQVTLLRGIFNDTQYNHMTPVPAYANNNARCYMSYEAEDGTLYYEPGKMYGVNGKLIVIIEYTKTTDT